MLVGIDVSSHQSAVDWSRVAGDGVDFAFVKSSGGAWYRNPYYADQLRGARAAGLVVGSYHYAFESSGSPGGDPIGEADYFCDTVGQLRPGDLVALDIEDGDGDLGSWALDWLRHVEARLGVRPFVYTGAWFSDAHGFPGTPELADYPLWLAAYAEDMPTPPAPWTAVAIWQHADDGLVDGVSTPVDLNQFDGTSDDLASYGNGGGAVADLPIYDPVEPTQAQDNSWDCSQQSISWCLWSWGRTPDDDWMENSMIAEGVISPSVGCLDRSGQGLADWVDRHYGEDGYVAECRGDGSITFDDIAAEAAELSHPLALSGWGWYHWTGCRGYDVAADTLLLANSADGYMGVYQTLSRDDFDRLGPWSLVRVTHPAAEGNVEPPPDALDYAPWEGYIGSGLLDMMRADGVLPAQSMSTWIPLGSPAADVEEAMAEDGTVYRWALTINQGFRYRPT